MALSPQHCFVSVPTEPLDRLVGFIIAPVMPQHYYTIDGAPSHVSQRVSGGISAVGVSPRRKKRGSVSVVRQGFAWWRSALPLGRLGWLRRPQTPRHKE